MKGILLLGLLLFSVVVRGNGLEDTQQMLLSNFTYVYQDFTQETLTFHTGEESFEGDCDDFAVAAYYQLWKLNLSPYLVVVETKNGGLHTIACTLVICMDNSQKHIYLTEQLKSLGYTVLISKPLSNEFINNNFLR